MKLSERLGARRAEGTDLPGLPGETMTPLRSPGAAAETQVSSLAARAARMVSSRDRSVAVTRSPPAGRTGRALR